ncbi:hypothetical protein BCV72DRAFT_307907 [Rhizopus microsporus var. microsporus]|uniref:Tc1-like transposase DDE domain-containing protein n=1 Tax=Rhizopus microsporus var. microsporus TaxID=86635 RepID=A0A1X0QVL5_RHIZD|nr:hypothetical protein BCV72DRAFT_307907 [Rhizopus microsporus var. microsporus]
MNIQFLFENGKGSVVDEYGRPEPMDYIVDEEQFPQRPLAIEEEEETMQMDNQIKDSNDVVKGTSAKRNYTRYSDQDKVRFFKLMFEKCLSAAAAATQLGIHARTGQKWAKQYEKDPESIFEKRRMGGRPRILYEKHKNIILRCIDENASIVLDELMKELKHIFIELKVSKTTLFDFAKQHCNLSLKKARLQPVGRNSEEKIQERLDWIRKWEKTDMDFTKNCVFLDEFAFHINLKRIIAWSKRGLIEYSLRLPQPPSNKKRKRGDNVGHASKGAVIGHYVSFLKATMDEMDQYQHMKGHYLVMDNAPIHISEDIANT